MSDSEMSAFCHTLLPRSGDGRPLRQWLGHNLRVKALSLLVSLATVLVSGCAASHSADPLAFERVLPSVQAEVWDITFSHDARMLAVATLDEHASVYNTDSGRQIARFRCSNDCHRVEFSPDNSLLLASGLFGALLWDIGSNTPIRTLPAHDAQFIDSGRKIWGTAPITVGPVLHRCWDAKTGNRAVPPPAWGGIYPSGVNTDLIRCRGFIYWTGGSRRINNGPPDASCIITCVTTDGKVVPTLVRAGPDGPPGNVHPRTPHNYAYEEDIKQWRTGSRIPLDAQFPVGVKQRYSAFLSGGSAEAAVMVSPGSGGDAVIYFFGTEDGSQRSSLAGPYEGVVLSPDGRLAALKTRDDHPDEGKIVCVDVRAGRIVAERSTHSAGIRALAWSPDSKRLATGGMDGNVVLWRVRE